MELAIAALTILLSVVGWLLANKDAKQAKEIELLFRKHDADVEALNTLRLEIAKEHYLKHELDARFQSLQDTVRLEMRGLGDKFDKMTDVLVKQLGNNTPS